MENPSSTVKIVGVVFLLAALAIVGWYVTKGNQAVTEISYQTVQTGSGNVVASGSIIVAP